MHDGAIRDIAWFEGLLLTVRLCSIELAIISVNGNAFRDSVNRNLRMLLGFGKFHGFATAVWNFALLFHLAGICGKFQPSTCGKVAEKDVEIF